MAASKSTGCMSRWIAGMRIAVVGALLVISGCSTAGKARVEAVSQSAGPMIAVRLSTVAAIQGDPVRAQRVVDECDYLIAQMEAGQSVALDLLVPLLNSRIAEAGLRPPERALLIELVTVAAAVVQAPDVLPADTRERLILVVGWVRSAALGQAV